MLIIKPESYPLDYIQIILRLKCTSSLSTALYGCEIWLLVLKKHNLQMSENGVLGKYLDVREDY